jgi:hypothetical protein
MFENAEDAHHAYVEAQARLDAGRPTRLETVLAEAKALFERHGVIALATPFLESSGISPHRLRSVGLHHRDLLARLGLREEYAAWKASKFRYRGKTKSRMTWELALEAARDLAAKEGDLPTVEWCRVNKRHDLTNFIFNTGRTWEELRAAIGLPPSVKFYGSRSGLRWRSRPEACLSNFLYARGIDHRRGERYPDDYAKRSGKAYGRFDLHFTSKAGKQIDVEIWGNLPDSMSANRYHKTRALKEAWHAGRESFLGIDYPDCLSDDKLTRILEPYIGIIQPFRFERPHDPFIETNHWTDADELLESCRAFARQMPDGIFPGDEWLRKRGRYANRGGEQYSTLATRVTEWMGGTRNVRKLLGQEAASTIAWTEETVIAAWRDFEAKHGVTPSQVKGAERRGEMDPKVVKEAQKIYEVARRLRVLDRARNGKSARHVKWTPDAIRAEWKAFFGEVGRTPTQCMSPSQRQSLPRSVTDRATNLYGAARRLGMLAQLRAVKT